ncbi:MAG: sodium:proton antiporter [Planctomycetaceae bacterium]|nr:sodium:proton antiporter [Planctomycetaceae bacterium]
MIFPFAMLLLAIAVFPLIPATAHWWESNLHRFYVAAGLGVLTLLYYGFVCNFPIDLHWPGHALTNPSDGAFAMMSTIFTNAIISEFIPFIVLLFALYSIAGGIRIKGDLKASPRTNSIILLIGAVMASFVGTTGAAMLLIRLLLDTNKERKYKVHTVVFFIFIVCNCGGCLLPTGDPPLFLGYLRGVDFLWPMHLWAEWAFVNLMLIALYFLFDAIFYYPHESKGDKANDAAHTEPLAILGWKLNVPLLLGVVLAVMFLAPEKNFFDGLGIKQIVAASGLQVEPWYPPYFLREAMQVLFVLISIAGGSFAIRKENDFNFNAIVEVAALFFGIFICMQAPLQILDAQGKNLPLKTPIHYYWATGSLSSVLDNAPTYVVFFEAAKAQEKAKRVEAEKAGGVTLEEYEKRSNTRLKVADGEIDWLLLVAISLGSVFMGAMTYIGNGPNFMVKAIAEQSGIKMPSFFGYMIYSCLILLPIYALMNYLFLLR